MSPVLGEVPMTLRIIVIHRPVLFTSDASIRMIRLDHYCYKEIHAWPHPQKFYFNVATCPRYPRYWYWYFSKASQVVLKCT